MEIKRKFYIFCFTLLGLVFGALLAEIGQLIYLKFLAADFAKYSFGLSWSDLGQFFMFFALLLIVFIGLWGYSAGKYWWEQIYVKRVFDKRWRKVWKH